MIRRVISGVGLAGGVVVALLGLLWLGQRRLIYLPAADPPSLEDAGLRGAEPVALDTADGLRLGAWFVPGDGPPPHPTIVVFNGNAGHRGYRAPLAAALRRHGVHVLLMDYRGYGGNRGAPSEEGLALDARAARTYLLTRPDVDPSRLVYFGESLGGAVAVRLAVEHAPAALILRSPFASLADVGRYHYPLLPVRLLLRDSFPSFERANRIQCPVLVIAGTRDTVIPLEHTRRLYDAIEAPKTLVEIEADHNDAVFLDGEAMTQAIVRFVATAVPPGQ